MRPNLNPACLPVCVLLLTAGALPCFANVAEAAEKLEAVTMEWPDHIQAVLDNTQPLEHPRGDRLPLYLWPAMNPGALSATEAETLVQELDRRGVALVCCWRLRESIEESLAAALPVARAQHKLGLRINVDATQVLHYFFDGDERTAHVDAEGNPFWDTSFGHQHMGCPFALEHRKGAMRERVEAFVRRYHEEGLPIGFIFADWEIDGPIEWNEAWSASKRCVRCRENVPDIDANFLAFQHALREIRSELQRFAYSAPVLEAFPNALVGNYAVYPHDGFRYWYDFFEQYVAGQPEIVEQGARYRHWANEFEGTGYTFAMPVVYPWSWAYFWYEFDHPDFRWFYNMLKVASNAGQRTPRDIPIITFVHWHTVSVGHEVGEGLKQFPTDVPQFSEEAYAELLWHMLLRGHSTFFLWCVPDDNAKEVSLLHPVWAAAQEFGEFLDHGTPITFETPSAPGTVVSGLRLGERVLVRRTDFTGNTGTFEMRVGVRTLRVPHAPGTCQVLTLD